MLESTVVSRRAVVTLGKRKQRGILRRNELRRQGYSGSFWFSRDTSGEF
jgi:hypothetical protein